MLGLLLGIKVFMSFKYRTCAVQDILQPRTSRLFAIVLIFVLSAFPVVILTFCLCDTDVRSVKDRETGEEEEEREQRAC